MMPARRELESWASTLTALLEPAPSNHIGYLVNTMANTMAMRAGQTQNVASRTDGWLLACGSLPADLWTDGVMELLKTKTFMATPGELMALVGRKFEERRRMLARAQRLLGDDPNTGKPKPFEPEPRVVRLRAMRDSYRKHGYADRAAKAEIELAGVEGREPEDWIRAAVGIPTTNGEEKPDAPPTRPPSPEMRAALDVVLARQHRAQGHTEYAKMLERRADAVARALERSAMEGIESAAMKSEPVLDEPPPHDAVPEMEMER